MSKDLGLYPLVELFSRGVHRVPVISGDHVISVVSQSSVIAHLALHLGGKQTEAFDKPLSQYHVIAQKVLSARPDEITQDVYRRMQQEVVDAVAVVDDGGRLIGSVSLSSLRGGSLQKLQEDFKLPVSKFLEQHSEEIAKSVASKADTTLKEAIMIVSENRAHRIWIIDNHGKLEGVATLGDLIRASMNALDHTKQPNRRNEFYVKQ